MWLSSANAMMSPVRLVTVIPGSSSEEIRMWFDGFEAVVSNLRILGDCLTSCSWYLNSFNKLESNTTICWIPSVKYLARISSEN